MKKISIISAHMENFKRFHEKDVEFGNKTTIFGQNYTGKSSVADLFSWVLFNKSSTGNSEGKQFRPRRYDENGVNVDHVDVVGEIVLMVDGQLNKIRKTQRQKWVRHRSDEYDSYTGDETIYEWNDVPVSATMHKKKVAEIISEDVFRMISNPSAFPSLPPKKQREFLLENVANITDADVFASNPEYELVKEAMGSGSLDELIAKNKKAIQGYEQKKKEIPVRIDQESKRIENIDFSKKESELARLQAALLYAESRLEDTGKAYEVINELRMKKAKEEMKLSEIRTGMDMEHRRKRKELSDALEESKNELDRLFRRNKVIQTEIKYRSEHIDLLESNIENLRKQFKEEISKTLSADSFVCPTCGQPLPEDQRGKIISEFEQKKDAKISEINEAGKKLSFDIGEMKAYVQKTEGEIQEIELKIGFAEKEKADHEKNLEEFESHPVNYMDNPEYVATFESIAKLGAEIDSFDTRDADAMKEQIRAEREEIQKAIDDVKSSLALKTVIEQSKTMVEELKAEMVDVVQKLANCEKLDMMIEKFNRAKMNMLSERINDKFKLVKWKLFEKQKNQRYAEVCVCQIHGSDYGENTTSATERMMAGMDIISTLQEIYQVEAPIFLDDADLYNDWNIPETDCQLIKLCVSEDDTDLRVEI